MRRTLLALALALTPVVLTPGASLAATMNLPLDQSALITLPAPAQNVVVGNPAIADVAVADPRHLVITAKSAGLTNLIVSDQRGRQIFNRQVLVTGFSPEGVNLIAGPQEMFYACTPACHAAMGVNGAPVQASPGH